MQSIKDTEILNSVSETYEGIAESWDRVRRRPGKIWDALLPYIPQGARVLDVGCGNGRLSEFLSGKNVRYTGLDGSAKLIGIARNRYSSLSSPSAIGDPDNDRGSRIKSGMTDVQFLVSDMRSLPFEDDAFDAVCCLAAFHHLPSESTRRRALSEMFRVTKPGGVLLMLNWNLYHPVKSFRYGLWRLLWNQRDVEIPWKLPEEKKVFHRYYHSFFLRELRALAGSEGWNVEKIEYINNNGHAYLWNGLFSFVVARKKGNTV